MPTDLLEAAQMVWSTLSSAWDFAQPGVASVLSWLDKHLTNDLLKAAVGSIAGAFFGAFAAKKIADRTKHRERIEKAVEDANGAILLAVDTLSVLTALKKQHIVGIVERYKAAQQALQAHIEDMESGRKARGTEFQVVLELRTLEELPISPDLLLRRVEEMHRLPGHIYLKAGAYRRSVIQLAAAINGRNKLIADWIADNVQRGFTKEQLYFGTPNRERHQNETYLSHILTLESAVNDGIGFSIAIANALNVHAKSIREQLGKDRPTVLGAKPLANFQNLIPDLASYEAFGVATPPDEKASDNA